MATLIKNGLLYDGLGNSPVKKDILIQNDRIAGIGNFSKKQAEEIIDATGCFVSPGFIDINTHSDYHLSIFSDNFQEDFIRQGVTTIIGGNCGESLAPFLCAEKSKSTKFGGQCSINVNWSTVSQFLKTLAKRGIGINFGTLVGYSTIRQFIVGKDERDLSDFELLLIKDEYKKALSDGVFGISSRFEKSYEKWTPKHELLELIKMTAEHGAVYATHVGDAKENIVSSIKETINIAKETGVNMEISHFSPHKKYSSEYAEGRLLMEKEIADARIHFDCFPGNSTPVSVHSFLPEWAHDIDKNVMLHNISIPNFRKRLIEYFKNIDAESITIGIVPTNLKIISGKTVKEFSESFGISNEEGFLKLMEISNMSAICFDKNIDTHIISDFLFSPLSLISSHFASFSHSQFSDKSHQSMRVFPEFLKLTKETNKIPFENAIMKLTSLPANKYKIKKRGVIKENYYADIVVLRENEPEYTIVNGKIVFEKSECKNKNAGYVLKHEK